MKKHSSKIKSQQLIERVQAEQHQVGKWLDNKIAADFLDEVVKNEPDINLPNRDKLYYIDLPNGVNGVSYLPDGTELTADKAIVIVKDNGGIRTAYPFNSNYPIDKIGTIIK